MVDDTEYATPTHLVDCFKGRVALELEGNIKDPFFDRDFDNFRLLFGRPRGRPGVSPSAGMQDATDA